MSGAVFLAYNPPPSRPVPAIQIPSRTSTAVSLPAPPPNSEVVETKRRKSSIAALKTIPLPFRSKRKDRDVPAPAHSKEVRLNLFPLLPTELQLQILEECSASDLLALRATSKEFSHLVTASDSAITRYWIGSRLNSVHRLYPTPEQEQWKYLMSQMHRWNGARHLAEMIANHIQYRTLFYVHQQASSPVLSSSMLAALLVPGPHSAPQAKLVAATFRPVAARIRRRMTPLLFIVSHYLSSVQQSLLDSQMAHSASGDPIADWFRSMEEPSRFTSYTRDQLHAANYCWLFLQWILQNILSRPSGPTLRGLTTTPLEGPVLTQVLVHGNLTAIKKLMQLKDYGERKKWAKAFLRSLDPAKNPGWSVVWESLDMRTGALPSKTLATAILRGPQKNQFLWTQGAERRLIAQGFTLDEELGVNPLTTMKFLQDMAGFDLFHEVPPDELEDEIESDAVSTRDADDEASEAEDGADPEEQGTAVEGEGGANYWDL